MSPKGKNIFADIAVFANIFAVACNYSAAKLSESLQ